MTGPPVGVLRSRLRALRDPVVTTPRLRLMLPDLARVPECVDLLNDRRISRWTLRIPFPYRTSDARSWILRAPVVRRAGTNVSFHVVRRVDDVLVGGVGVHALDAEHRRGEVGYWIGRHYRRQGFATEALLAVRGLAFRRLGLHRLEARVFPGNHASVGVLRAAGFRREGRLRESIMKGGRPYDELVYASLAGEPGSSGRRAARAGRVPSAPTR